MYNDNIKVILFCEIIINPGVLIFVDFVDFVVHAKLKNSNPTKYNFPIDCFLYRLKPGIQEPKDHGILLKFTNTSVNKQK